MKFAALFVILALCSTGFINASPLADDQPITTEDGIDNKYQTPTSNKVKSIEYMTSPVSEDKKTTQFEYSTPASYDEKTSDGPSTSSESSKDFDSSTSTVTSAKPDTFNKTHVSSSYPTVSTVSYETKTPASRSFNHSHRFNHSTSVPFNYTTVPSHSYNQTHRFNYSTPFPHYYNATHGYNQSIVAPHGFNQSHRFNHSIHSNYSTPLAFFNHTVFNNHSLANSSINHHFNATGGLNSTIYNKYNNTRLNGYNHTLNNTIYHRLSNLNQTHFGGFNSTNGTYLQPNGTFYNGTFSMPQNMSYFHLNGTNFARSYVNHTFGNQMNFTYPNYFNGSTQFVNISRPIDFNNTNLNYTRPLYSDFMIANNTMNQFNSSNGFNGPSSLPDINEVKSLLTELRSLESSLESKLNSLDAITNNLNPHPKSPHYHNEKETIRITEKKRRTERKGNSEIIEDSETKKVIDRENNWDQ